LEQNSGLLSRKYAGFTRGSVIFIGLNSQSWVFGPLNEDVAATCRTDWIYEIDGARSQKELSSGVFFAGVNVTAVETIMAKRLYLTAIENIALSLVFLVMNERRFNRSLAEYLSIAAKLPPLKALLQKVNELLKEMHQKSNDAGVPLPLICRFQAGDERYELEDYPREISRETLRLALAISGMRPPRRRAKSF
jgi:hypothetical protein